MFFFFRKLCFFCIESKRNELDYLYENEQLFLKGASID